jgi:hypothetical protein
MPIYRTDFEVEASDADVWAALVDFEQYPQWNPSLPSISGELKEGSIVSLTLGLPGKSPMKVTAKFEQIQPKRLMTWRGKVGGAWLFSGYRVFEIQALTPTKTKVTHVEDIDGLLAPLFKLLMGDAVQQSHDGFNDALRRRAELLRK